MNSISEHTVVTTVLLAAASWIMLSGSHPLLADAPTTTGSVTNSPFTNTIPVSTFRELTSRDPFWPIGYQKPSPKSHTAEKPVVEFKLELIGVVGEGMGILKSGQIIEVGEIYDYPSKDGKTQVKYKVVKITEAGVDADYDGKVYHFKPISLDTESFKEKEAP